MNLSDFATPMAAKNNFIKASFGGFAGSGKTRTATEFIIGAYKDLGYTKPIMFIDNEKGSRFLVPKFNDANIECLVKDTVYLADVTTAFTFLQNGEISLLFIDSLTKIYYQFVNEYRRKNNKVFMSLNDWGKVIPEWQVRFSDPYVNLEGSCVFTGRGGYEYTQEENEETKKKEFVKSGVKLKLAGETAFEPDLNIWMDQQQKVDHDGNLTVWREAQILKDRSSLIDGKIFKNPTYSDFQPVVQYLLNVKKGDVAGASYENSYAPVDNHDYGTARNIEIEKVKALFEKHQFSTKAEDKFIKVLICEKIFKTSSNTEIESMKVEVLRDRRIELETFFEKWDSLWNLEEKKKYTSEYKSITL